MLRKSRRENFKELAYPTEREFEHLLAVLKLNLKLCWDIDVKTFAPEETATFHGLSDDRLADFDARISDGDGRSISVRSEIPARLQVFHLLHLFGHIVQSNTEVATRVRPPEIYLGKVEVTEEAIQKHMVFEREAAGYGAYLLRESGAAKFLQWFSDMSAADLKFLTDVFRGVHVEVPQPGTDMLALVEKRTQEYLPEFEGSPKLESLRVPSVMSWQEQIKKLANGQIANGARVL